METKKNNYWMVYSQTKKKQNNIEYEASDGCREENIGEKVEDEDTDSSLTKVKETNKFEQESEEQCLARFKEIHLKLKEITIELEVAVEAEDYDEAAVLDEKLQDLKNELESLGHSDSVLSSVSDEQQNKISGNTIDIACELLDENDENKDMKKNIALGGSEKDDEESLESNATIKSQTSDNAIDKSASLLSDEIKYIATSDSEEESKCTEHSHEKNDKSM